MVTVLFYLKIVFLCLLRCFLSCIISDEKSAIVHIIFPGIYVFIVLVALKMFSLCFINFTIMYLGGFSSVFILQGACWTSWIIGLIFSSNLESFSCYYFKYFFFCLLISSGLHTPITYRLETWYYSMVINNLLIFLSFFFFSFF